MSMIQKVKKVLVLFVLQQYVHANISFEQRKHSSSENQHILISTFNLLHLTYCISYIHWNGLFKINW